MSYTKPWSSFIAGGGGRVNGIPVHTHADDQNTGTQGGGEPRATQEILLVQSDRDERYIYETESEIGKKSLKASL